MTNKEIWDAMKRADMLERTIVSMIYSRANKEAIIDRVNKLVDLNKQLCLDIVEIQESKCYSEITNDQKMNTESDGLQMTEFTVGR